MTWKAIVGAGALALGLSAVPAAAAPITGILNITGAASVTATTIDWIPIGGGSGTFDITFPGTQYFADIYQPVSGVNTGTSLDLPAGPFPVTNFLNSFTTPFPQYDDLSFTLEGFTLPVVPVCGTADATGVAGDNPGESCVAFAGSPFTLTMGDNGVSTDIHFNVFGSFVDPTFGDNGSLNNATGLYTSNIANMTPLQIQTQIGGGGAVDASYSAQFIAEAVSETGRSVPEPVTLSLLGLGLTASGYRLRRNKRG
jgi:hypothetical protein